MIYYRGEALHERRAAIHADLPSAAVFIRGFDCCESDLMVLIGGPMAEFIWAFGDVRDLLSSTVS